MIIKCGPFRKAGVPILVMLQIITLYLFVEYKELFSEQPEIVIVFICVYVLMDINLILDAYVIFRTIIMDENGVTISFFKQKKEYTWEQIAVKRLEKGYRRLRRRDPMQGIYFSVYPSKKSRNRDPYWYCMFHNPFQHFFVYLEDVKEENRLSIELTSTFTKDRNEFLSKLSLWGVQLTIE